MRQYAALPQMAGIGILEPLGRGLGEPGQVMKRFLHIEVPRWQGLLEHMSIGLSLLAFEAILARTGSTCPFKLIWW